MQPKRPLEHEPIAIVGIGCKLPGGINSPAALWQFLLDGKNAIEEIPSQRWSKDRFYSADTTVPGKTHTRWAGMLRDPALFDAAFFGITPREAKRVDPQHRWLLEVAYQALEDSNTTQEKLAGKNVGVYIGISSNDYASIQAKGRRQVDLHTNSGSALSIAANRISYQFDLRGPSLAIDTACSSSLVAIHQACQSIWSNESSCALAGGVNALLTPDLTIGFSKAGMLSPDGRCYAFDARANGYVRSEGAAIVFLKPLSKALSDGDVPYALIRASVVNQDGHSTGLTVPSASAQSKMIEEAYQAAKISPHEVQYIEAHGTGTQVGDPIEATALGEILGQGREASNPLFIGSVKSNLGHLESASGVVGLIKTALILRHKTVPTNLNFETPSPNIDFKKLALKVPTSLQKLQSEKSIFAGVNSFGFGGTNAHIVLESAQQSSNSEINETETKQAQLLLLSAKSSTSLKNLAASYKELLLSNLELKISDLCSTAAHSRSHFSYRASFIANSRESLAKELENYVTSSIAQTSVPAKNTSSPVFLFTGQGPQWNGMAHDLFAQEPVFRKVIEECDLHFTALGAESVLAQFSNSFQEVQLEDTAVAQPALFALQIALVTLLESWGIKPGAVLGHSIGEAAAAYTAGLYSLKECCRLVFERSRLQQRFHGLGKMAAAALSLEKANEVLRNYPLEIEIAAINGPEFVTLSGKAKAIDSLVARLRSENIFVKELSVAYAFHSAQMEPIQNELLNALESLKSKQSTIPFYSSVTGVSQRSIENSAQYWWQNVRAPVLFSKACEAALSDQFTNFIEIGPHPTLTGMLRKIVAAKAGATPIFSAATLHREKQDRLSLLELAAALYQQGAVLNWNALYLKNSFQSVTLPHYAWDKKEYWLESEESRTQRLGARVHPFLGVRQNSPVPTWQSTIDLKEFSFLADHQVDGSVMFPASAFIEIFLAVAQETMGPQPFSVKDISFINALFLPEQEEVVLQSVYQPISQIVSIYSQRPSQSLEWMLHASATVSKSPLVHGFPQLDQNTAPIGHVSAAELYQSFKKAGYDYGAAFCGVSSIERITETSSRAKIAPASSIAHSSHLFFFHPAILDACLQTLRGVKQFESAAESSLFLPTLLGHLSLIKPPQGQLNCEVKLTHRSDAFVAANFFVYDCDNSLVATIIGFRCRSMGARKNAQVLPFYQNRFVAASPQQGPLLQETTPRTILLFADQGDAAKELCRVLMSTSRHNLFVVHKSAECLLDNSENLQIRANDKQDFIYLLQHLSSKCSSVDQVIYLWPLDLGEADAINLDRVELLSATAPLFLIQTLSHFQAFKHTQLFFLSKSTQNIDAPGVSAAPLWGLGRVFLNESRQHRLKLIDIDATDSATITQVALIINSQSDEPEFLIRQGEAKVSRLIAISLSDFPLRAPKRPADQLASPYRLCLTTAGSTQALKYYSSERKPPAADEVEVLVFNVGLNFRDVLKSLGLYPGDLSDLESFGDEFSGTVLSVGNTVTRFKPGDAVLGVTRGAISSHLTLKVSNLYLKPASLSFEQAASIPIAYLTAWYSLMVRGNLRPNESVLIHAAAGGVGLAAVKIAQLCGARIFATAGSDSKRAFLKELGVEHVMDSRSLAFVEEMKALTNGRGVDVVLNSLSAEFISQSMSLLAPGGRFLELGKRDIFAGSLFPLSLFKNGITLHAIDLAISMKEQPDLFAEIFLLILDKIEKAQLSPLPVTSFSASKIQEAIRFMSQGKHCGKIALQLKDSEQVLLEDQSESLFRNDSSYLLVGGLGGLGIALSEWLIDQGARHLILMSRSGPSSLEALSAMQKMRERGASIHLEVGDVSKRDDVERALAKCGKIYPKLKGVFHLAMVVETGFIGELTQKRMHDALAPKVAGSWNLHRATQKIELDYFVLFSSAAALLGGPGHASYSAANCFLDALANERQNQKLPALCINWGLFGDVGYVSKNSQTQSYFDSMGIEAISSSEAFDWLKQLLKREVSLIAAMRLNWRTFTRHIEATLLSTRFEQIPHQREASTVESLRAGALRDELRSLPKQDRPAYLIRFLSKKIASVSGIDATTINPHASLLDIGLDSLMSFQLKLEIDRDLNISIDPIKLIQVRNLDELSLTLLEIIPIEENEEPLNEIQSKYAEGA